MFGWIKRLRGPKDWQMVLTTDSVKFKTWKVGDMIGGKWRVIQVHSGGFGVVYIATNPTLTDSNPQLPAVYALKTFRPDLFRGPVTFDEFEREAYLWIKLGHHDNIVNALFFERHANAPFVVSEAIVNKTQPNTLRGWLQGGPIPLPWVLLFGTQICIAMEYARSRGLVAHSDLKPDNILVTDTGLLKVSDWGLSTLMRREASFKRCVSQEVSVFFRRMSILPRKLLEVHYPTWPPKS